MWVEISKWYGLESRPVNRIKTRLVSKYELSVHPEKLLLIISFALFKFLFLFLRYFYFYIIFILTYIFPTRLLLFIYFLSVYRLAFSPLSVALFLYCGYIASTEPRCDFKPVSMVTKDLLSWNWRKRGQLLSALLRWLAIFLKEIFPVFLCTCVFFPFQT